MRRNLLCCLRLISSASQITKRYHFDEKMNIRSYFPCNLHSCCSCHRYLCYNITKSPHRHNADTLSMWSWHTSIVWLVVVMRWCSEVVRLVLLYIFFALMFWYASFMLILYIHSICMLPTYIMLYFWMMFWFIELLHTIVELLLLLYALWIDTALQCTVGSRQVSALGRISYDW